MTWPGRGYSRNSASRARTPTVLQMEAVECGAAALGSILAYHGLRVALEELRVECGVSRDGVTAKNLIRAARKFGLIAKGFKKTLPGLLEIAPPTVLFWNFNHFLVFEGTKGDQVYLNDPATGPRTVSRKELDESFTGVVLTFEPGPDFQPGGEAPSLVRSLAKRLSGSEAAVAFLTIAGLALVIPGLVIPVFSKIFVDQYLVARLDSWVKPLLIAMGLTAALRGILTWLREHYLLRLETKLAVSNSTEFFWHVLRLPMEFFAQRYAGEVSHRVSLNDQVARLLAGRIASTFIDAVMIVFFAGLMFLYDWTLTLLGILMVSLNLVFIRAMNRARVDGNLRLLQEEGKYSGTIVGSLQNIETIKATSRESELFSTLAGFQAKVVNAQQDLGTKTLWFSSGPQMLTTFTQTAVLAFGGLRVMQGELTMGMLVAFQSLMASFVAPVNSLMGLAGRLQEMVGNMNRLDDVFRYPVDVRVEEEGHRSAPQEVRRLAGRVELRNVTFGYSRLAPPLLSDFNLRLEPGARVALVGRSGSGKSTVSKLVSQLYQPWEGEILFDGVPADELPREVLAASIAFVDQSLTLFEGTVSENLTLWDEGLPEARLITACKDALIHEDVTSRPGGYESLIGEGGGNFSGGQRQRLDIARALAGGPSILVLDEATSALDTVTEKRIDANMRRLGCTCVIVAHRLSTIRDCDEILVLDAGRVVQRGTHEELLKDEQGLYARLIQD